MHPWYLFLIQQVNCKFGWNFDSIFSYTCEQCYFKKFSHPSFLSLSSADGSTVLSFSAVISISADSAVTSSEYLSFPFPIEGSPLSLGGFHLHFKDFGGLGTLKIVGMAFHFNSFLKSALFSSNCDSSKWSWMKMNIKSDIKYRFSKANMTNLNDHIFIFNKLKFILTSHNCECSVGCHLSCQQFWTHFALLFFSFGNLNNLVPLDEWLLQFGTTQ